MKNEMEKFYLLNIPIKNLYINFLLRNVNTEYYNATYENIKKHGLQKPLIVREIHSSKYNILVGGSRYLVLLKLKQTKVPCVVITKNTYEDKYRIKSYKELLKIIKTKEFIYKNGAISNRFS